MTARIAVVALALLATAAQAGDDPKPASVLVEYHFDDEDLATGPDTMLIIQRAKGTVRLSERYRYSGTRSVEVRSVAGDGNFPELQGYLANRKQGTLAFHFALLVANPTEKLNIAIAGPAHFNLSRHGLAFWLTTTENGKLAHVTNQKTEELFDLRAFTWYVVDCTYRIDAGLYDLTVREEGVPEPVTALKNQKNANGDGGSIDRYSFVSNPFRDTSNSLFYVDDVVLSTDTAVRRAPMVAPGRRKLFVDRWHDYRRKLAGKPGCMPLSGAADVGVPATMLERRKSEGVLDLLLRAAEGQGAEAPASLDADGRHLVEAATQWRQGCEAAALFEHTEALGHFDAALALAPQARAYPLARVLTLAALHRWPEMEAAWSAIYSDWREDARFPLIVAMIGLARGELSEAESWLRLPAELAPRSATHQAVQRLWCERGLGPDLVTALRTATPGEWQEALHNRLAAEEYFYVLLWQQRWALAAEYATRMATRLEELKLLAPEWIERAGDAGFFAGDYRAALGRYEESLRKNPGSTQAYLRLSDAWFRLGDIDKERHYREAIYGVLK